MTNLQRFHQCSYNFLLRNLQKKNISLLRILSQSFASEKAAHDVVAHEKINLTKPSVIKWKRPPFVKGFFFGKCDVELLKFPEILEKQHLSELETYAKSINNLIHQKVNVSHVDENQELPEDLFQDLKDLGLFGRTIPVKYGGLELSYTACTRLNEVLAFDWSLCASLAVHEFHASKTLLDYGSESLKSQYLPKLASGEMIAAFCSSEPNSGNDMHLTETKAVENSDGTFTLTGTKTWVANAPKAGVFIVFANIQNPLNPELSPLSVFLVERSTQGVFVELQHTTCLRGLQTGTVHFKGVRIPTSQLIGKPQQGFKIYMKALESLRIALNTFTFGALKILVDSVTKHVIHIERAENSLANHPLIKTRLSRISSMIYGMESACYLTAGILDSTESPDVEFEAAALKIFNTEGTTFCIRELMELVGSTSFLPSMQLQRFHRDALALHMFDSSHDVARLFLGLSGLKIIGNEKNEDILKHRNPAFFPRHTFKQMVRDWKLSRKSRSHDQNIAGHVHPSLVEWGNKFEETLQNFEAVVEYILSKHGRNVVDAEVDPVKVGSVASILYVWSSVISRCTRSYNIGLKNSSHEVRMADAFCYDIHARANQYIDELFTGIKYCNESSHLSTGEQIIDSKGYFPEHPLKHNY